MCRIANNQSLPTLRCKNEFVPRPWKPQPNSRKAAKDSKGHDLVDPDFAVVDFEGDVSEHVAHERLVVGLLALRVELNSGHRHFEGSTR